MIKANTGFRGNYAGIQASIKAGVRILLFALILIVTISVPQPALADPILTVTPITWNVIGLDSNRTADIINTPNVFHI